MTISQLLGRLGENLLDPLLAASRRLSRYCAWGGGIIFFAVALLITAEVIVRKAFSMSITGADELSGYGFAIATTFAFAYATLERAHIRVDTAYLYLSPVWQALLDLLAALLLLIFFGLLLWRGWEVVAETFRMNAQSNTPLHTPLIYPQFAWWLGLLLTVFVAVLLLLRATIHILLGQFAASRALIGARGMDEEIADELAILDQRAAQESSPR